MTFVVSSLISAFRNFSFGLLLSVILLGEAHSEILVYKLISGSARGKKIDNGNSGKTNTILFALGQKAEPATMVESLRKGFNKMKSNEANPAMQRLAAFLIDALDDAVEA